MRLNELEIGSTAQIVKIEDNKKTTRLHDLGFVPGVDITCVTCSPLKNPRMYRLLSTSVALRNEDAKLIEVRKYKR